MGEGRFDDKVKPFLKEFLQNSKLDVGPDGTNIGFLMFSGDKQTKVVRNMTDDQNVETILPWLTSLRFYDVSSEEGTRTGKALWMVNKVRTSSLLILKFLKNDTAGGGDFLRHRLERHVFLKFLNNGTRTIKCMFCASKSPSNIFTATLVLPHYPRTVSNRYYNNFSEHCDVFCGLK